MNKNLIKIQVQDALAERFNVPKERMIDARFLDADTGIAFMISQLSYIEPKLYETPYADIFFEKLVPIDTSIPEWSDTVNYRSYDGKVMGKFIGSYADDLDSVAMQAELHTVKLGYAGLSAKYSLDEMRKSAALGMPIDQTQIRLCYRGAKEHQQQVVFFGDNRRGMFGLFNHPNVTTSNSSVDWNTASADEILEDINSVMGDVWEDSNQRFMPNTLCLDTKRFRLIATKRINAVSMDTVLDFIREKNIATIERGIKLDIRPIPFLQAKYMNQYAGDNKDRMICYDKNIDNLKSYMPIAPRFTAPQYHNLTVSSCMEYKISGTEFIYPQSAAYRTFTTAMS